MSVNVMTMDEIDEVSGAWTWFGVASAFSTGWAVITDISFGYNDMRGNRYDNPFPISKNPIPIPGGNVNILQVTGGFQIDKKYLTVR